MGGNLIFLTFVYFHYSYFTKFCSNFLYFIIFSHFVDFQARSDNLRGKNWMWSEEFVKCRKQSLCCGIQHSVLRHMNWLRTICCRMNRHVPRHVISQKIHYKLYVVAYHTMCYGIHFPKIFTVSYMLRHALLYAAAYEENFSVYSIACKIYPTCII